jgi:hypothetical protein
VEPVVRPDLELIFGGPPSQEPFEYQRSSILDLDAAGNPIPGGRHMATNLAFVDTRTYYATNDSLDYLQTQSQALRSYMQSLPFAAYEERVVLAPGSCFNQAGLPDGHCWESMDTVELYDWFETKSLLETPPFGSCLADRDGRWHGFEIFQEQEGRFSSFDFVVDPANDVLEITEINNIRGLNFDITGRGFDPAASLQVSLTSSDGSSHLVSIHGLTSRPTIVTRNGLGAIESCVIGIFPSWCYDASTGVLTLIEPAGQPGDWEFMP